MNKSLLAVALGLGVAGISHAGTVYMTGSTAMRSTVYAALNAPGVVFTAAPSVTLFQGGGSGANFMAFSGTLVGGAGSTTVQCHWSGSEGGINDVAAGTLETFIDPALLDGTDHGTAVPATTITHAADLAMADNSQAYSRTKTPVLTTGAKVGVITFKWVRNNGLWTGTNVTSSMIRQALGGFCPRAVFSGNAADVNDYVYVSGRDNMSGTRVNAFGDSGFGIFTVPNQIEMNNSGVMQNLDGAGTYAGDFGFTSGGTLAKTMGADTTVASDLWNSVTGYSVIAYLSAGDAATAITAGAKELAYNGVAFSPEAVKEGTYTFWGNEYIYRANGAGTEAQSVYTKLAATSGINNYCDGVKAIKLTDMHTKRNSPAGDPSHN
ncbi:MAG TPA: hypothetical protein VK327_12325 [Candidatus Paceibacterota bacterium]|nr:hypothetical protein [Candidatus Paceibacterota bacterium]